MEMDSMNSDSQAEKGADDESIYERSSEDEMRNDSAPEEEPLQSSSPRKDSAHFSDLKWTRHRKKYNDDYLELFNTTHASACDHEQSANFQTTQIGAVYWTSQEKAKLFQILPIKGRHNLPALSDYVGSKSQIEVKHYLDVIREAEGDRQLFLAQTKNISHPEIPAAIEIGSEFEAMLEQAADALAAFQEQYDSAVGREIGTSRWLIDHDTAALIDNESQLAEDVAGNPDSDGDEVEHESDGVERLFHIGQFIALSEGLFMNQGPDSLHDHWKDIAEEGQTPAITSEALEFINNILVNSTRKIVQTSLFMAKSRIRSSTRVDYHPTPVVRAEDVTAALTSSI